jgi:tether containing UBX domain for GLUT4
VCEKFPEFKAEDYDLKHHNRVVDLSQFFRFSGLPNNCTLEMAEAAKKRVEQDVVICLQLEDNTRLNGSFQPAKTLYEIITEMAPEKSSEDQSPVVIYMRTEIYGDKLKSTTLRSLGLASGGRALLRLINSDPESLKVQANVSAPLPQKPKEEEPEKPRPRAVTADSPSFQFQSTQQLKAPEKVDAIAEKDEERMEVEDAPAVQQKPSTSAAAVEEKKQETIEEEKMEDLPEPIVNILDERGTIIFTLDSMNMSSFELPDNFFDFTEHDVKLLYKDLRKQVKDFEDAPLMTAELRRLEENKKILNQLSTYKSCALRIQFPDRHVIQTKFSTVEKIENVMEFVRQFLIDPKMDFHLYFTPPKFILDKDVTLIESHCVPSALMHFGCDENIKEFLKPEYFDKLSSGFGASSVLLDENKSDNQPSTSGEAAAASSSSPSSSTSIPKNFMESKATAKPSGAVPKWFKPSK